MPDESEIQLNVSVNGEQLSRSVSPRLSLADFLRSDLELTGTHLACEHGACGACTVQVNGEMVRGCLMLAVQANGCEVRTIEASADSGALSDLQDAFHSRNSLQCGFCTAGMLMTAYELLQHVAHPSRQEIREYLAGNYCRCTGYEAIVDAIEQVATARADNGQGDQRV